MKVFEGKIGDLIKINIFIELNLDQPINAYYRVIFQYLGLENDIFVLSKGETHFTE